MKRTKAIKLVMETIFAAMILIMTGCVEGPAGTDGAQGDQGPQGPQGTQGEPGTANVIYSDWSNIVWNYINNSTNKTMYIEEKRVLGDFMDKGTLFVFIKTESPDGKVVFPLPVTEDSHILTYAIADAPSQGLEGIAILFESIDGNPLSDLSGFQIRYVLIPGGVPAKMGENFLKDYEAVKAYYGIPDEPAGF